MSGIWLADPGGFSPKRIKAPASSRHRPAGSQPFQKKKPLRPGVPPPRVGAVDGVDPWHISIVEEARQAGQRRQPVFLGQADGLAPRRLWAAANVLGFRVNAE